MKKFLLVLVAVLFVLSGCSKAPADDSTDTNTDPAPVTYKAGMGSVSSFSNSDVEDGEDGSIEHDTTVCALVVDSEGKIVAVTFNTSQIRGTISGEDATVTLTVVASSPRAVPFASCTKSRPLDNSSWIMY